MLQLGQMIASSLAVMAVCAGMTAIGASYVSNIPERDSAEIAQADHAMPAWMDPETTGAIKPKVEGSSAHAEALPLELMTGGTAWVDPPRHSKVGDRSASVIEQTMGLRLQRP